MKQTLSTIVIAAIVAVVATTAFLSFTPATTIVQQIAGNPGPDVFNWTHFYDNVNIGGNSFATSSRGTVTYTAASIIRSRVIEHNAEAATTASLPTNAALSSAGFLPNVGDTQSFFIQASTTLITIAGNTGVTLASASTTRIIYSGRMGRIECVRLGATESRLIQCLMTQN